MSNADMMKMMSSKKSNLIAEFEAKYNLDDDSEVFFCYNENYLEPYQFPHEITGKRVREKLLDDYYRIEYKGKNPNTKMARVAEEAARKVEEAKRNVEEAKAKLAASIEAGEVSEPNHTIAPAKPRRKGAIID